ncbi:hypothetical protein AcV7_006594 [Taiwanofungus camphoratus]|nr:hypothetical protein AcV7_006594 [Antrodia cinnamomea]
MYLCSSPAGNIRAQTSTTASVSLTRHANSHSSAKSSSPLGLTTAIVDTEYCSAPSPLCAAGSQIWHLQRHAHADDHLLERVIWLFGRTGGLDNGSQCLRVDVSALR